MNTTNITQLERHTLALICAWGPFYDSLADGVEDNLLLEVAGYTSILELGKAERGALSSLVKKGIVKFYSETTPQKRCVVLAGDGLSLSDIEKIIKS